MLKTIKIVIASSLTWVIIVCVSMHSCLEYMLIIVRYELHYESKS
jgi:hypothetical protein